MKRKPSKFSVKSLAHVALFAAVIAVCAWLSVPSPVPFTMQTFGVFLALLVLGGKHGSLAVLVYVLLGVVGLPVFSGFTGGVGAVLGTGGGYILGFPVAAAVAWLCERLLGKGTPSRILAMVLALASLYTVGTLWYVAVYTKTAGAIGFWSALAACVLPYLLPDALKLALAFLVARRLAHAIK